jgi:hypothetical protein
VCLKIHTCLAFVVCVLRDHSPSLSLFLYVVFASLVETVWYLLQTLLESSSGVHFNIFMLCSKNLNAKK